MELLNAIVTHKSFGEGIIIEQTDTSITVDFSDATKKFSYPNAFEKFLICKDVGLQEIITNEINEHKQAVYSGYNVKIQEISQINANKNAVNQGTRKPSGKLAKNSNNNNLAFKCNFCDGGCGNNSIGFKGVCSDEQIKYNIEKKKYKWCSNVDCLCYKYYNGEIDRNELEVQHTEQAFVCYESIMLVDWEAYAGDDLTNEGNHKSRRIDNAASDCLAVLTTEFPDGKGRYVFGAFITGAVDDGDDLQSGYVKAKSDYYIELTPDEARKMPFWKYYKNGNSDKMLWGMGLYRYFADMVAARILADIVELKTGKEKEHAQHMLEYYCELKNIDIDNIPQASGVLAQK